MHKTRQALITQVMVPAGGAGNSVYCVQNVSRISGNDLFSLDSRSLSLAHSLYPFRAINDCTSGIRLLGRQGTQKHSNLGYVFAVHP